MTKSVEIIPVFVEGSLPENKDVQPNHIYISRQYGGSKHKCFCGCGEDVYIRINKAEDTDGAGWNLTEQDGKVSITPSLQNRFDCRAHYVITNNIVNFGSVINCGFYC